MRHKAKETENVTHLLRSIYPCPDLPPPGTFLTHHTLTWFPESVTCEKCKVRWDECVELGWTTDEDGRAKEP